MQLSVKTFKVGHFRFGRFSAMRVSVGSGAFWGIVFSYAVFEQE